MRSCNKVTRIILSVLLLHILFASYRLFPLIQNFHPFSFFIPMGELLLLIVIMNGKNQRFLRISASLLLLSFLVFYLSGELFFRLIYLESFDMLADMKFIPGFFVMLMPEGFISVEIIRAGAVFLTVLLSLLTASLLFSVLQKHSGITVLSLNFPVKILLSAAAAALMLFSPAASPLLMTSGIIGRRPLYADQSVVSPVSEIQVEESVSLQNIVDPVEDIKGPEWAFSKIQDSDIHFAVIESYGAVLFQRPEYQKFILNLYKRLQLLLDDDGWTVKSGYVLSPAFGGRSWLADATLLTGEQIVNQKVFDERLERGEPASLLTDMKKAGYRSYYIAPGSTRASEEWKKAYPFDTYFLQADFAYEGPFVGFGKMTDQYIYDFFSSNIMRDDEKEFAFYLLVSSHTPFERIPVYKEDWDFSQKGREYEKGYIKYFENNWLHGNELAQGYLEGISYSLETTIRYLTEILPDKQFMLIIGDHQPRKPVSVPDPGYPVLFHIILPSEYSVSFPEDWNLSDGLIPPELPHNFNTLPEMAAIPDLVEQLIK